MANADAPAGDTVADHARSLIAEADALEHHADQLEMWITDEFVGLIVGGELPPIGMSDDPAVLDSVSKYLDGLEGAGHSRAIAKAYRMAARRLEG